MKTEWEGKRNVGIDRKCRTKHPLLGVKIMRSSLKKEYETGRTRYHALR